MLCDREALRWKLTWVRVTREGFLEEWVPEPIPGEEQAVDKWVGKWRAFGRGKQGAGGMAAGRNPHADVGTVLQVAVVWPRAANDTFGV